MDVLEMTLDAASMSKYFDIDAASSVVSFMSYV